MSRIFITTISILLSVKLFAMENIDMMQINDNEQSLKQQTTPVLVGDPISEDREDNGMSIQDNLQIYNETNKIESIIQGKLDAHTTLIFDMVNNISNNINSLSDAIGANNAHINSVTEEQFNNHSAFLVDIFGNMSNKIDFLSETVCNLAQNQTLSATKAVVPMNEGDQVQTISVNEPVMNSNLKGAKEDLENVGETGKELVGKGKDFFAAISNFFNNLCCKKKVTEESIKNDISKLENKAATGKFLLENFQRSQIIE